MTRSYFCRGQLISIFALGGLAACAADAPVAPMDPEGTIAASSRSSADLGVATWEIGTEGSDARIIGRDASAARQVDLIVRRDTATPDDRVWLDVSFPERGTIELTRDGLVEAAASAYLRHLGEDVHADLGQGQARAIAASGSGLGSTMSSLVGDPVDSFHGQIPIGWDLFGHGTTETESGTCRSGMIRDHVECSADNNVGSTCSWGSWLLQGSPYRDVSIRFTVWVPGGHWDNFRWFIFCRPVDLALGKPANQSSTGFGGTADRAVDGDTNGNWFHGSVTHTNFEFQPWWEVDLGAQTNIGSVVLFNRTDCCADRLSDFNLEFSNDHFNWDATPFFGMAAPRTEFTSLNMQARWVRVHLRGSNFLSLAGVQIFAP
jgi:hypothetical protein